MDVAAPLLAIGAPSQTRNVQGFLNINNAAPTGLGLNLVYRPQLQAIAQANGIAWIDVDRCVQQQGLPSVNQAALQAGQHVECWCAEAGSREKPAPTALWARMKTVRLVLASAFEKQAPINPCVPIALRLAPPQVRNPSAITASVTTAAPAFATAAATALAASTSQMTYATLNTEAAPCVCGVYARQCVQVAPTQLWDAGNE